MVNLADEKRSIRSIIALSPPNPAPITVGHEHICLARPLHFANAPNFNCFLLPALPKMEKCNFLKIPQCPDS